jgi:hypothetical protein
VRRRLPLSIDGGLFQECSCSPTQDGHAPAGTAWPDVTKNVGINWSRLVGDLTLERGGYDRVVYLLRATNVAVHNRILNGSMCTGTSERSERGIDNVNGGSITLESTRFPWNMNTLS